MALGKSSCPLLSSRLTQFSLPLTDWDDAPWCLDRLSVWQTELRLRRLERLGQAALLSIPKVACRGFKKKPAEDDGEQGVKELCHVCFGGNRA